MSVCACRVVLLSAQCQGGVNGLSAISGAQLVYPNEHNSKSTPANCKEERLPIDAAPKLEITGEMNIHENNASHSSTVAISPDAYMPAYTNTDVFFESSYPHC